MTTKKFKCPFCKKVYLSKQPLYTHMETNHEEQLNGLSPANVYFNMKYNKTEGKCIICGKKTSFNEETERYDRLCSDKCKEAYREEFKKRMMKKYNKTMLLDDPEHQKKMQNNRKISGVYTWSDGKKFNYLGTYEKDALEFLDGVLNLRSEDVIVPAPIVVRYIFNGNEHFYMPDIYIVPYNLLIEVKGTNGHYQKRDYDKEKAKDIAALKSEYNYVKLVDKKYDALLSIIDKIKSVNDDSKIINK